MVRRANFQFGSALAGNAASRGCSLQVILHKTLNHPPGRAHSLSDCPKHLLGAAELPNQSVASVALRRFDASLCERIGGDIDSLPLDCQRARQAGLAHGRRHSCVVSAIRKSERRPFDSEGGSQLVERYCEVVTKCFGAANKIAVRV